MTENTLNRQGQFQDGYHLSSRVLDSITAEIAVLDRNGAIVAVNKAWSRFAEENGGTPKSTGVGVNYMEVCRSASGDDSLAGEMVLQGIDQVRAGVRDVFRFEYPCHSANENRWFLLHISRLDSAESFVVMTHLPITQRKLTEQRLVVAERLAAIGEAMNGLSHVGRNALQQAQANIALLGLQLTGNSDGLELVRKIENAQDRLLDLYEEVKRYADPIHLRCRPCCLESLVQKIWRHREPTKEHVRCTIEVEANRTICEIDSKMVGRVLDEILDNALAAVNRTQAQDGVIEIIMIDDVLDSLPAITLIISDNGPGIHPSEWESAFNPFHTIKTHGTGLGLAVSKRIVEAHHGRIQIGAPRAGGTSVYLTFSMTSSQLD